MIARSTLEQLEFTRVLELLADFTHSEATRRAVADVRPLEDLEAIRQRQARVEEVRRLNREGRPLPLVPFIDLEPFLNRVRPLGAILEPLELAAVTPVLRMFGLLRAHLEGDDDFPRLNSLIVDLRDQAELRLRLERSLDEEGHILDRASPQLADLRAQVRQLEARIRKQLTELVRDQGLSSLLQDDFITQRSGRWVIPVRLEARKQISGVVHDVSRSGETAFVEPLAILQLSNQLENLVAEVKAEENRILRELSAELRRIAGELEAGLRVLVTLDLVQGAAALADQLQCEPPEITSGGPIRMVQGRHPLLQRAYQQQSGSAAIVPLDLQLGNEAGVMVITGSNAGGKTVALKTVGLLLLMAQSGLPVPARETSSFPLVENLLVDIGDDQSIETSLSTFSAHMRHIARILQSAGPGTLVLLDELGTSTDPDEGSALACAILSRLQEQGALVLATTHLTGIKVFAERAVGLINAAMEFDPVTLTPLYRLKTGQPGLSHALEVAGQYGLDPALIARAREFLGGRKVELDRLILDLNRQRDHFEQALGEIRVREARLLEQQRELDQAREALQGERKKILAETYREASGYLVDMRRRMQALLDELRKQGRARGRETLQEVERVRSQVQEQLRRVAPEEDIVPLTPEALRPGEVVFAPSLGYDAEVVSVLQKSGRLRLRAGGLEIEVPAGAVSRPRGRRPAPKTPRAAVRPLAESPPGRLSLIGLRVDEALSRLEPFLNQASLGGRPEVVIVHGFGEGILARAVQDHLKNHPLVKAYRPGAASEGGAGATVATLS